ncbi:MAG TPA: phosphatase PAP2 family protein [Streptosporangiaceae bacterium]
MSSPPDQAAVSRHGAAEPPESPRPQPERPDRPGRPGPGRDPGGHSLVPVVAVSVATLVFAALLLLIRLKWAPLESADRSAADHINRLIAGQHTVVSIVKYVTMLGSTIVLSIVIAAAVLLLALRRRWRLAAYLTVAGVGELILDPVLKDLVGRLRPVVPHAIQHAPGHSFPSGHSFGSMVVYGALFLVFAPAARGRARTALGVVLAVLIAVVGISRILLGVHYVSDVIGGWALGITWLGLTAAAFELSRRAGGRPSSDPVAEGLEPEAGADLRPAQPESAGQARPGAGRIAAGLAVAWVLILGVVTGLGELVTKKGNGNVLGDRTVPHWLAAHRTPTLTTWSAFFTTLGGTICIAAVAALACLVVLGLTRRWRPVLFLLVLLAGEVAMFLAAGSVVGRARPAGVTHLDHHLPTSAYPSGHEAATCCLYIGLAVLAIGLGRGWWRWLFLIPAIAFPVLVALSRMYRGEHHPTDIAGSLLFAALWIPVATRLIKPGKAKPAGLAEPAGIPAGG